jgi:putative chitinase
MITAEQLRQMDIGLEWLDPLNETFNRWGIDTAEEQACFIGQFSYESNHFKDLSENLNYRPETLMKLWPKRFPTMEEALTYAHQPEKIANHIYQLRMGNRDEKSGDGWRFRGSAICQLTGHDNFWHAGQALGIDLVHNPDLARTPKYAAQIGGWYWKTHKCNEAAQAKDYRKLTEIINGGLFGVDQRIALTKKCEDICRA